MGAKIKMEEQTKPYMFFDQNVMEKISKNQYDSFQRNVKQLTGKKMQRLTPFGLLEFAGLKKSELFDREHNGNKLNEYPFCSFQEIEDFIPHLRKTIKQKISKEFLRSKLQEKKERETSYLNQWGKGLIDKYISALDKAPDPRSKNKHIYCSVIDNLLLDRVSQINISKLSAEDKKKFITGCVDLTMGILHHNLIMGSLRLVCRVSQETKRDPEQKQLLKNNPHWRGTWLKDNKICENLKPGGDLVDCELIHLAFFGNNNKFFHCFTTDNEQDIVERLDFYCFYISFFIRLFFDSTPYKGRPPDDIAYQYTRPKWRCGKVFILDKNTGTKIKKISVTKIYEKIIES